jgi:uncharacterized membrane protein YgcG
MRKVVLVLALALGACGEPAVDIEIPQRPDGEYVLDSAGILDEAALEQRLAKVADAGTDIVALTYETEQASCGEAYRAARQFVRTWNADIALVAVAHPGDFASDDEQSRERCLGVQPLEDRAVPGDLRERIAEELIPPLTADNDWDAAFEVAVDALAKP